MQAGVLEGSLEDISAEFNTEKSGAMSPFQKAGSWSTTRIGPWMSCLTGG